MEYKISQYIREKIESFYQKLDNLIPNPQLVPAYVSGDIPIIQNSNLEGLINPLVFHGSNYGKPHKARLKPGWKNRKGKRKKPQEEKKKYISKNS